MKLSDILKNSDINSKHDIEISGISTNSKEVKKNYIFFAIKGTGTDGNLFINEAIKNGAKIIITEQEVKCENVIILKTSDPLKALSILSRNFYNDPSSKLNVIGITGTKGKTTTSFIIDEMFNSLNKKTGVIGTINYRTHKRIISDAENTTPLAHKLNSLLVQMVKEGDENVVMEVSSHSLKLKRVEDIEFDSAIFTNLQSDHLDFHKTFEDYADSKLTLFKLLNKSAKKTKTAIINLDDEFSNKIKNVLNPDIRLISYSLQKDAELRAKNIYITTSGSTFDLIYRNKTHRLKTNLIGIHNIYNILAAFSLAIANNMDIDIVADIISKIEGIVGRLEKIESKLGFFVYIDYAHTEESLTQVLKTINSLSHFRIITVFGCGGDRDTTKRPLMGKVASNLSDMVIITTDNPRTEEPIKIIKDIEKGILETKNKNYMVIQDREQAINYAINMAKKGDIILIAGKGHENYQIIGKEKINFSDRKTVEKALGKIEKKREQPDET